MIKCSTKKIMMMFFYFLHKFISAFDLSNYVEITEQNKKMYFKGEKPILVKFYSPNCDVCQEMEEPFNQASQYFDDALFGGVNCLNAKVLTVIFKLFIRAAC